MEAKCGGKKSTGTRGKEARSGMSGPRWRSKWVKAEGVEINWSWRDWTMDEAKECTTRFQDMQRLQESWCGFDDEMEKDAACPKWGNFPLGEHCRFFLPVLFFGIPEFCTGDFSFYFCFCICVWVCFLARVAASLVPRVLAPPLLPPLCRSLAPIHSLIGNRGVMASHGSIYRSSSCSFFFFY